MGKSDPIRLPDGGGEKERGSGPEGFDRVAVEGDGDYLSECQRSAIDMYVGEVVKVIYSDEEAYRQSYRYDGGI